MTGPLRGSGKLRMLLRGEFLTPLRYPYINQLTSSVSTYLYGRRMYESMVY